MTIDQTAQMVRSAAEAMLSEGIQWRIDPRHLIALCDAVAALPASDHAGLAARLVKEADNMQFNECLDSMDDGIALMREAATALASHTTPHGDTQSTLHSTGETQTTALSAGVRDEWVYLVHDWEIAVDGRRYEYARTPERAERLAKQGHKLTPVYTRHPASELSALSDAPVVTEDDVAATLWRTEVIDAGVPPSVIARRTRDAFENESDSTKDKWRKYAKAAIAALGGGK